jgi:hypothetical protein
MVSGGNPTSTLKILESEKTMAKLRLEKVNGQWYLINKTSGKILAETTEETQRALRHIALTGGSQFTLEVI